MAKFNVEVPFAETRDVGAILTSLAGGPAIVVSTAWVPEVHLVLEVIADNGMDVMNAMTFATRDSYLSVHINEA